MVAGPGLAASTGTTDAPIPSRAAQISAPQNGQPIMILVKTIYRERNLTITSLVSKNLRLLRGNSSDTLGVACGVYSTPRSNIFRWSAIIFF